MQRQYKKYILLFWGVMDVIAIATYLFYSLGNGRIPFYSDIVHSLSLLKDIGVEGGFYAYAVATVTLQIVLLLSLFFSAQCFLRQKKFRNTKMAIQEVKLKATVSCSISVIPLLLNYFHSQNLVLN
uniref:hypothetical protein n=1 Tax=Escherichia coli TaxID=562 RepID=UPI0013D62A7F